MNALTAIGKNMLPAISVTFLVGTPMHIATAVSILATAVFFGMAHLHNDHKNNVSQSINATISGIALGILATHFGLIASIGAHMVNNTLAMFCILSSRPSPHIPLPTSAQQPA